MKSHPTLEIKEGHAITRLRGMDAESIHCFVTSPPYWGLRDYKTDKVMFDAVEFVPMVSMPAVSFPQWYGHLGMEPCPLMYVGHIVQVFSEAKRVLRKDGTLWLNLGDSYAGGGNGGGGSFAQDGIRAAKPGTDKNVPARMGNRGCAGGLKTKDRVGIPWMVALALQADGWYLRCDIIWSKPNPMPGSQKDRPTTAHEYIFLLTRSKHYFYDHEAIKEPVTCPPEASRNRWDTKTHLIPGQKPQKRESRAKGKHGSTLTGSPYGRHFLGDAIPENERRHEDDKQSGHSRVHKGFNDRWDENEAAGIFNATRNKRSVWTIATSPYQEAHFATFPPEIPRTAILAGTSNKGACAKCGAPWIRIVKNGEPNLAHQQACGGGLAGEYNGTATKDFEAHKAQDASATKARILKGLVEKKTTGWKPTCKCRCKEVVPCKVGDMFGGSGTTCEAALNLGRSAMMIELAAHYIPLARKRTGSSDEHLPLFAAEELTPPRQ